MKKVFITRHRLFKELFGVFPVGSKFDKKNFLCALPNLLPTTPATTLETWQNASFVCGFDILKFLQKIDVLETIFPYGNFSIIKAKLDGPILESFLQFRNSRQHFHRCASVGVVDFDFGKGNFCAVSAILHPWDKNCHLRQRLPFSGHKLPFQKQNFSKGYYRLFFIVGAKLPFCDKSCLFGQKVAVFRTLTAVWGIKCRFRDDFLLAQFSAIFSSFNGNFFQILTAKLGCPTYDLKGCLTLAAFEQPQGLRIFSILIDDCNYFSLSFYKEDIPMLAKHHKKFPQSSETTARCKCHTQMKRTFSHR